jgi:sporulation protein YlmC with PRC-barrel domain
MNTTPLKTVAVAALIGLSPALVAQSSMNNQSGSQQQGTRSSSSSGQQQQQVQGSSQQSGSQASNRTQSSVRSTRDDPRGQHASDLIGWEVKGQAGEKLGDVNDFIIDSRSGKVVYAVIASGGVLGVGETLRAVPFTALRHDATAGEERLTLNIDQAKWEQAPSFMRDQLASLSQEQRRQQIFQYYGQSSQAQSTSPRSGPGQNQGGASGAQGQSGAQSAQQLVLASAVIGKEIQSGSQNVGTVEDVIVQIKNRTAAALIDPSDDFAGTDQKFIVPFNKLTKAGEDSLTTTLSRQDFTSAKPSRDDTWGNESLGYLSTLYIWPSYAAPINQQAGIHRGLDQTQSQSGEMQSGSRQAPVAAIRQALQGESSQGTINVTATGDKVVLSGTVKTEDAKDRIEDRAEQAAPGWDIDNQLRVAQQDE